MQIVLHNVNHYKVVTFLSYHRTVKAKCLLNQNTKTTLLLSFVSVILDLFIAIVHRININ